MHKDPTIVHTVADLRREAVLAEAASIARAAPDSARTKSSPSITRWLVTSIAAAISARQRGSHVAPSIAHLRVRSDSIPNRDPISHGGNNPLLAFGTVAVVLGLAAVTASLAPSTDGTVVLRPHWPRSSIGRAMAAAVPPPQADPASVQLLAMPMDLADRAASPAFPAVSATGPWASPLYPQNGVTLWDRIRSSTSGDRPAFLLGTAIQLHAPATASTPGPQFAPPLLRPARASTP